MLSPKNIFHAFYRAAHNLVVHDGFELAGYLAFLELLAMFPFMVFVVALAGFMGEGHAGTEFIKLIFAELPTNMVRALQPRVAEIISGPPQGLLTLSIVGAIWTSSSAVEGYRTVLNRAYHVGTPPAYILRRLLSIAQILILSFAIVSAMIMLVMLPILWTKFETLFGKTLPLSSDTGELLAWLSVGVIFLVAAFAYYILPNIKQSLLSVVPGAALATLLWIVGARLLSLYLSQFNQVNLIYGSLGGVIAALLFFYTSNLIFIYGAEFNYLLAKALGTKLEQRRAARATVNDL